MTNAHNTTPQKRKHTANAHNTAKYILFAACFLFWLCCEHLQHVLCQIDESVFLICRLFFAYLQRVSFLVVLWALQHVRCQMTKVFSLICRCFFLFAARFFFLVCVSICSVCVVKLRKLFLNLQVFFSISNQIKSNQITFIVTSPQHKCLVSEILMSVYSAPDSAKNNNNTIYIWTVHIYRLYRRQCAKYTYIYSVHIGVL